MRGVVKLTEVKPLNPLHPVATGSVTNLDDLCYIEVCFSRSTGLLRIEPLNSPVSRRSFSLSFEFSNVYYKSYKFVTLPARCFANPDIVAVLVDLLVSNTRVHHFYERLGFKRINRQQFGDDDCFVYRLNREDWRSDGIW